LFAYAQAELVNAWRVTNQKDMEAQAKKLGVKLVSIDANQDASKQLADVENMLAQKPTCLIVSPLESKASAPVVKLATDAKVPLVIIDRTIEATPGEGMYKTEITQSHVTSGKLLAEKTVELLTKKNGEPKGSVVHVQGLAGASPVIDANKGWDEVMAKYPNIKVVATSDAGFTKDGGMKVMDDFLQRFPKGQIDVVRSDYSDMTMGAVEAIKNAGRTELLGFVVGEGGHIKALQAVVAGDIARETQTPPYFGEKAMQACSDILAGKTVAAQQQVDIKVFDADKKDEAQKYIDQITGLGLEF
jgi:ribose transport system substrate-binding protein